MTNLNHIAKFDTLANAWSALPNNGLGGNQVNTLAVSGGDLYAGGYFGSTADGEVPNLGNIAKLSGGEWSALPNRGLSNGVYAIAVSGNVLYAGGLFNQTGDGSVTNLNFIAKLSITPTAATLTSFTARASNDRVVLKWKTGSELEVVGFNVWRREANQNAFQKLNAALIPAQNPGGVTGSNYTYNDNNVQAGKTYRYKLEVKTNNKSEWSNVVKVTMPDACTGAPDTPTPTGPADGKTIKTLRANLKWQAVNCATTYEIVVRQGKRDGKIIDQAKDLTTTQYKTVALKAGKTYVWRVRACNADACGKWSAWQSFAVQANNPPQ